MGTRLKRFVLTKFGIICALKKPVFSYGIFNCYILECIKILKKMEDGKKEALLYKKKMAVVLARMGVALCTKMLLVQFPIRAETWVVGLVPGGGAQGATYQWSHINISLSPSSFLSL